MLYEYSFYTASLNHSDAEPSLEDGYMSEDDIEAIQDLFDEFGIEGPEPDFEGYAFYDENGGSIRYRCHDLDSGDAITGIPVELVVPELSEFYLNMILKIAHTGKLALTSVTGEDVRLIGITPTPQHHGYWPDAQSIDTATDLKQWLDTVIKPREVSG